MALLKNDITNYLQNLSINFKCVSHKADKSVELKCNKCSFIININWQNFKRKHNYQCKNCNKISNITQKFKNFNLGEIIKIYNEKGTGNRTRCFLDFRCLAGHLNNHVRWENLLRSEACPQCNNPIITWNEKEIMNLLSKNGFTLVSNLEENPKASSPIEIKDSDSYCYSTTPHRLNRSIKHGNLNPFQYTHFKAMNFKNWVKLNRPDYEILNDDDSLSTANQTSKINFKYLGDQLPIDINPSFKCSFNKFKQGQSHPYFKSRSNGETYISKILNDLQISYKHLFEIHFNNQKFYFDFAILDDKQLPLYFIEYHGKQHFEEVKHFGGATALNKQIKHDKLKKEYADLKKIKFIEIRKETLNRFQTILENEGIISTISN